MEKYKFYEDLSLILSRTNKVFAVVSVLILVLVFFCWKVQILDYKKYWNLAEANRTRESVIIAPRGLITDSDDIILPEERAGAVSSRSSPSRSTRPGTTRSAAWPPMSSATCRNSPKRN